MGNKIILLMLLVLLCSCRNYHNSELDATGNTMNFTSTEGATNNCGEFVAEVSSEYARSYSGADLDINMESNNMDNCGETTITNDINIYSDISASEIKQNLLPEYSEIFISYDEIVELVEKNKKAYSLFYEIDSTDKKIENSVFSVNMKDFNDFNSFYSFVSSIYTSSEVNKLFNNFMGQGKSFWEEDGKFLVDINVVTSSSATSLYSEQDEIEVVSESEDECSIIYWFNTPHHVCVNDSVIYKTFGIIVPIVKENGIWKLSEMIRPTWNPTNIVFKTDDQIDIESR